MKMDRRVTLLQKIPLLGLSVGLLGCGLLGCANSNDTIQAQSSAILGGIEAEKSVADVRLSVPKISGPPNEAGLYSACSGVFIGERVVLTAAHCISDARAPHTVEISVDEKKHTFQSQKVIVHPGYLKTGNWPDLAVIILTPELLERAPAIRPVAMLKIPEAPRSSFEILSAGYGKTSANVSTNDGRLRVVALRVVMYEPTLEYFRVGFPEGKGFCQGDSGGPALVRSQSGALGVLGLAVSTEEGCVYSGHYLNLTPFAGWIQSVLR